jgi:PAS domain S-box-containing protein
MIGYKTPSLSKNLTISLVIVIIVLSMVFIGIYYYQVSKNAAWQLEKKADEYIHSIADTLEIPLWDMDRENINMVCNYYVQNEWVVMVKLTGISGEVMFHKNIKAQGNFINRSREISYDDETIGLVEIALSSFESHKDQLESLKVVATALIICMIGVIFFTGFLLKKLIKGPMAVLGRIAESYSKGDYHPKIHFTRYKEFDTFVSVLFKMGETIESQMNELRNVEASLKKHRDSLEETVAERTMELKISNKELHNEIQHRKQAQEALRMNEQRLEAILRSSPVGIGLMLKGQLNWANETMYIMIGYERNELLGQDTAILFKDPKEYNRCFKVNTKNISKSSSKSVETQWIRKDGTIFDCMIRMYPLDIQDPSKGQIFAVADISDTKASEQALREKDRLQGVLELSGAVCHEMSQPLMSVMGYFDLIQMEIRNDDPNFRRIKKIQIQLDRMSNITKKLMEISRYETKKYLNGQILDLSKSSEVDLNGK